MYRSSMAALRLAMTIRKVEAFRWIVGAILHDIDGSPEEFHRRLTA